MTIGKIIQSARKKAGLTQVELGQAIGVSGSMIGQWENDLRKPKPATIGRLAEALGTTFMSSFCDDVDGFVATHSIEALLSEDIARAQIREQQAEEEFQAHIAEFTSSVIGRSIISTFYSLNRYGQLEANDRILELTFLPQFINDDIPPEWDEYVDSYLNDRYYVEYQRTKQEGPQKSGDKDEIMKDE